jgi:hypothetical protein
MTLPQRATIQCLEPEQQTPIEVMFNPDLITYTKQNTWNYQLPSGQSLPEISFASGIPATLVVPLTFDGTEDGENIAKKVKALTKLTQADKTLKGRRYSNPNPGKSKAAQNVDQGRPPTVRFAWGNYLSFDAVIKQIVSKYTMFLDDGTPVRAAVELTLMQIADEDVFPKQNPTSGGRTGERIHRLAPRETLDQVAYAIFGQTGLWRALAEFNGIDDPLRLQAGDPILLPASADDLKALA